MSESGAARQAYQTPWYKRSKAEREAVYQDREANRKATLERKLDRAASKQAPHVDNPPTIDIDPTPVEAPRSQTVSGMQAEAVRSMEKANRLMSIALWLELLPAALFAVAVLAIIVLVIALLI